MTQYATLSDQIIPSSNKTVGVGRRTARSLASFNSLTDHAGPMSRNTAEWEIAE